MCGRASLTKQEKELESRFDASFYQEDIVRYNPLPNFNVAPSHYVPVLTDQDPDHFHPFRWGLVPFWAKDHKIGYRMINARIETADEKPAFRQAFAKRRCIIPFDGFYEWKKCPDGQKQPYWIHCPDNDIFTIAGLWETWRQPDGETLYSFTLITRPPNELMTLVHDRMPAILPRHRERDWLDPDLPVDKAKQLILDLDPVLEAVPVSSRVGNVRNNDEALLQPTGPPLTID